MYKVQGHGALLSRLLSFLTLVPALLCAWLLALSTPEIRRVFRVDPKAKGSEHALVPKQRCPSEGALEYEIVGCGISVANPITRTGCTYIMAATAGTELVYFSVHGDRLQTVDTKMISQNYACLSPDGHLTAICGRLGMVRLMEVRPTNLDVCHSPHA